MKQLVRFRFEPGMLFQAKHDLHVILDGNIFSGFGPSWKEVDKGNWLLYLEPNNKVFGTYLCLTTFSRCKISFDMAVHDLEPSESNMEVIK